MSATFVLLFISLYSQIEDTEIAKLSYFKQLNIYQLKSIYYSLHLQSSVSQLLTESREQEYCLDFKQFGSFPDSSHCPHHALQGSEQAVRCPGGGLVQLFWHGYDWLWWGTVGWGWGNPWVSGHDQKVNWMVLHMCEVFVQIPWSWQAGILCYQQQHQA